MADPLGPLLGKTPNYKFNLINFNWFAWHDYEHENWQLADALFFILLDIQNVRGVWQPNTEMFVGERWVDPEDGTLWEVLVDHVSGSGTFAEDRIANPTYWSNVGTGEGNVTGPGASSTWANTVFLNTTGRSIGQTANPTFPDRLRITENIDGTGIIFEGTPVALGDGFMHPRLRATDGAGTDRTLQLVGKGVTIDPTEVGVELCTVNGNLTVTAQILEGANRIVHTAQEGGVGVPIYNVIKMTAAEYTGLPVKDPNTLYLIEGTV